MQKLELIKFNLLIVYIICTFVITSSIIAINGIHNLHTIKTMISKNNNYILESHIKFTSASQKTIAKNHLVSCRYSRQLQAGNYIADVDFPAGSYTFIALQGNGLIISSKPQKQYSIGINSHRILS
jgi:hypothetical protein